VAALSAHKSLVKPCTSFYRCFTIVDGKLPVTFRGLKDHKYFPTAVGAALTVLCGLLLHQMPGAQSWIDASYDYLFRFSSRAVTNKVVVVQMDEASAQALNTERLSWDRELQVQLLNKLIEDACPLVVFDVRFEKERESKKDEALANAMRHHGRVVLAARTIGEKIEGADPAQIIPPHQRFVEAATNWGIAMLYPAGAPIRQHCPPTPMDGFPSLPQTSALLTGAKLDSDPEEQWIRYYGDGGGLDCLSYRIALTKPPKFFQNRIVFIGNKPQSDDPDVNEDDKFRTPYTSWTGRAVGGVEILATEYLNLVNNEWLRRAPKNVERMVLGFFGIILGIGFCLFGRAATFGIGVGAALLLTIIGVSLSYYTNYWFPWLIVVGGQLPCALAWAIMVPTRVPGSRQAEEKKPTPDRTIRLNFPEGELPDAPEYEVITPEIGKGGFGKVWIVRNAIGQWQALKAVYESNFGGNRGPYEAEFKGLQRYKPVSEKHPGLLRIDLVSKMKEAGYFYYVMELGDAQAPGWEKQPKLYKPKDLENLRKQAYERRLPPKECLRIVTMLADGLNFLHSQGLIHRDIKPSNVIFVQGRPKLADVGLVANIRPPDQVHTLVGTLGYMPPRPEKPGTPQADIYALGMLLYVISTGRDPGLFPDLSTTLIERSGHAEFLPLNKIILKACQPDLDKRYQSTTEMLNDLKEIN